MQYKLENDSLLPAPRNFRTPEGATICNFNLSPELMTAYGYTLTEAEAEAWRQAHPAPELRPTVRTRCTKYELIRALRKHFPELLVELQRAYAADDELQFYWNSVNELDRTNQDFLAAVDKLGMSEEQINTIFEVI